jgi:two-component system OmpR family response regulator
LKHFQVLQIDDDPLVLKLVAAALGADPAITLTSCASAEEGIAIAKVNPPDLILCDVVMPGMSGTDLLSQLREKPCTSAIPLIFVTARAQPADIEALLARGAAAVISKPFKLRTFAQTIHEHLHSTEIIVDTKPLAPIDYDFAERLCSDEKALKRLRDDLTIEPDSAIVIDDLRRCAHKLAGAAGIYEFLKISDAASSKRC